MLIALLKRVRHAVLTLVDQAEFDWRYGTKTSAFVEAKTITDKANKASSGFNYQPTDVNEFFRIIRHIPEPRAGLTFIDFGCGKGRVLLMAAQAGFQNIIGVELSPALSRIAQDNIAAFQQRFPGARINVAVVDATNFPLPAGDCVLYCFNPFGAKMMERLSENLRVEYDRHPRRFFIALWHCSRYYEFFDKLSFLRRVASGNRRRNWLTKPIYEWIVYGPQSESYE